MQQKSVERKLALALSKHQGATATESVSGNSIGRYLSTVILLAII